MQEARQTYLTPEEYLALERQSETKSEYFNGEIYAMSGASEAHNLIFANLVSLLIIALRGRPCKTYPSDMRVQVRATGLYTYPDASVVCGRAEFSNQQKNTLRNPTVVFEVLSSTTESYDRGAKFAHYRTLESLTDYVLVLQTEARIEHFARQATDKWLLSVYQGLGAVALLPSIDCELPLTDLYDKVELPPAETVTLRIVREHQSEYEYEDDAYAHPSYPNGNR
jgi:Uma2 family endonuclease